MPDVAPKLTASGKRRGRPPKPKGPPAPGTTFGGGIGGDHPRAVESAPRNPTPTTPAAAARQAFENFLEKYGEDPVLFAEEVLGAKPKRWQREFMQCVAEGKRRISIKAGHGVGKSTAVAWVLIWSILTRAPQKSVCLSGDTSILSNRGWIPLKDIQTQDLIWDGLEWVRHQGLINKGVRETITVAGIRLTAEHLLLCGERWVPALQVARDRKILSRALATGSANLPSWAMSSASWGSSQLTDQLWCNAIAAHRSTGPLAAICAAASQGAACFAASRTLLRRARRMFATAKSLLTTTSAIPCFSASTIFGGVVTKRQTSPTIHMAVAASAAGGLTSTASVLSGKSTRPSGAERCWNTLSRFLAGKFAGTKSTGLTTTRDMNREIFGSFLGAKISATSALSTKCKRGFSNWKPRTPNCAAEPVYDLLNCGPRNRFTVLSDRGPIIAHNCTAPTAPQLFDALFAELKTWVTKLPPALRGLLEVYSDRIEMKGDPDGSFISARTSSADKPEAMAGIHSTHVLLIADEASGIPEAVFEAATGSMSGHNATTILIGNPTRLTGLFYRSHNELADRWHRMTVSCMDPDLADLIDEDFVAQVRDTYGEDSPQFKIRVLGEFPATEENNLISPELVDAAMRRDVVLDQHAPLVFGVDVARFGGDRSVICKRQGNVVIEIISRTGNDLMETTGWVISEARKDNPAEILVDSIGLGAGVADRLRELKYNVRDVNVAESAALNPQAARLRDELWLSCRDWLQQRACKLPKMDDLRVELSAPLYKFNSNGTYKIESKDEMRKRIRRSPDLADALVITFAGEAAIIGGRAMKWVSGQPLKRGLRGIV